MAEAVLLKDTYIGVLYGDGATPQVFTLLCLGQSEKGLTITYASAYETTLKDCADPEDVGHIVREVGAQDWSISISGQMNRSNQEDLRALLGTSLDWRFEQDEPSGETVDDGYWQGRGFITEWNIGASDGEHVTISISITGAGELTWADA